MGKAKINILKEKIANFCKQNHIRRLYLFGSVLLRDFGPRCDVDVLVEFESGTRGRPLGPITALASLTAAPCETAAVQVIGASSK